MPYLYDITVGEDGLYVEGTGYKIAVYRCAPNGECIHHINTDPSLNLSNIRSICFDSSGHLIVGNCGVSTGVYVFHSSGEHVASLSLASSGGIKCPAGMATDDDGFVYVCDCLSNGIIAVFYIISHNDFWGFMKFQICYIDDECLCVICTAIILCSSCLITKKCHNNYNNLLFCHFRSVTCLPSLIIIILIIQLCAHIIMNSNLEGQCFSQD